MNREDFDYLRQPLIGCLLVFVVLGVIAIGGWYGVKQLKQENHQLQSRVQQAEAGRQQHAQEQAQAKASQPAFEKLQARGVLAPEDRLAWVEKLTHWQSLVSLDYQIEPQGRFDAPASVEHIIAYRTPIRLTAAVKDEEQALQLVEDVQTGTGWPLQNYCVMQLMPNAEVGRWVSVQCQIDWVTMGVA